MFNKQPFNDPTILLRNYNLYATNIKILRNQLEIAIKRKEVIDIALSQLNEEEYGIIKHSLIEGNSVESYMMLYPIERSSLYRLRNIALEKISLLLYGDFNQNDSKNI